MRVSDILLRLCGVRRDLRRGPCYLEMRASAERVYGDLSLPGEPCDARMRRAGDWPDRGSPFDEYDGEGHLHGFDRAEHIEMRRWAGRART
jgi:hypothetical protein